MRLDIEGESSILIIVKRTLVTAVLAVFVAGSTAKAETTLLLDYKDWRVELGQYEIDQKYCVAETINRDDEVFSLIKARDEALNLLLSVDGANWSMQFVDDLVIQIDDQNWWLDGADFVNLNGESIVTVSLEAQDRIKWQDFLGDLAQGETVKLMDKYGDMTLAAWSLFGSAAALLKMSECTNSWR